MPPPIDYGAEVHAVPICAFAASVATCVTGASTCSSADAAGMTSRPAIATPKRSEARFEPVFMRIPLIPCDLLVRRTRRARKRRICEPQGCDKGFRQVLAFCRNVRCPRASKPAPVRTAYASRRWPPERERAARSRPFEIVLKEAVNAPSDFSTSVSRKLQLQRHLQSWR